jgi:hypothetical protein
MKICPVGSEFHADRRTGGRADERIDRQTDVTKLVVAFCNSANAPENLVPFYSANHTKPINTIDRKQCL